MNIPLHERDRDPPATVQVPQALTALLVLQNGCNLLSVAGVSDVLSAARDGTRPFSVALVSADGAPVFSASGLTIQVDGKWNAQSLPEILVVFGAEAVWNKSDPALARRLRSAWRNGAMVCGVGTGITALAQAGLLSGRRFSLSWPERSEFQRHWPDLTPSTDGFSLDHKVATCPDGTLVTDMALQIVEDRLGNAALRDAMQRCGVVNRRSGSLPQTARLASKTGGDHHVMRQAVKFIAENFTDLEAVHDLAHNFSISRRHLERLFQTHLGVSPAQHVMNLKLEHAHRLLAQTNLTVQQVAQRAGFANSVQLSKWFRRAFGQSPSKFSVHG